MTTWNRKDLVFSLAMATIAAVVAVLWYLAIYYPTDIKQADILLYTKSITGF